MINKFKQQDLTQEDVIIRKDSNAEGFRELHNRYYPNVYSYSLKKLDNRDRAIIETNAYFVGIARSITNLQQPEEYVDRLSTNVEEVRKANKFN